jgi:purine catabolism regulatory family protein/PucR-like helix-turn-helix protein/diguanylate cyclase with GGDEF domain
MQMTVRELVDDSDLRLRVVVDGPLDVPVQWVHTTELADPSRYLQGGEVILTTGVWRAAGVTSERFVAPLAGSRVAALGYGLPEPDAVVPDDLIAACRARGLPLFAVPFEMPFIAVSRAFVDRFVGQRERALRAVVRRNDRLVRAAGHGAGLAGLLAVLDPALRAWVAGPGARATPAGGGRLPPEPELRAVLAAAGGVQPDPPVPVGGWWVFPIAAVGRTEAHLVVWAGEALSDAQRAAIDQTLPFLGLELAHARATRETERRLAAELVDLVLAGPAQLQAASARLETFGLDPAGPLVAVACESERLDECLDALERALGELGLPAIAAAHGGELVAVLGRPGAAAGLEELARRLHARLDGGVVGIGGLADDARGLRRSVLEGRQACRFARLRRDGGYAAHHQVGSHSLLLALQDEDVLAAFRRALLEPLEQHDARRRTELVRSLELFLSSGGRWQATAQALHVHVNTLRHRLARVERLTGRDLSSMEDRVDFFIALRSR